MGDGFGRIVRPTGANEQRPVKERFEEEKDHNGNRDEIRKTIRDGSRGWVDRIFYTIS